MKKKLLLFPCSFLLALTISGCNGGASLFSSQNSVAPSSESSTSEISSESSNNQTSNTSNNPATSKTSNNPSSSATSSNPSSSATSNKTSNSSAATPSSSAATPSSSAPASSSSSTASSSVPNSSDDVYSITNDTLSQGAYDSEKDEYTFSIAKNYKQIYVNAPDKTIIAELEGVTIQNSDNSPIYVADCDGFELSAKKNTTNYIKDTRATYVEDVDGQGKGAICVENGDLKLKGTGTLNITANYLNGIHAKDDVKVQKQTLNITAIGHGIRGNDSVTITSGTINISCGGDGLHSENSDISSKGNQRGDVTVNGGTLTINSWGDSVAAAYNAVFEELDSSAPISFTAKTNKYSSYSGEVVDTSTTSFYLKVSNTNYANGAYTYAAYINDTWYPATYKGTQSSGGQGGSGGGFPGGGGGSQSTYHIYQLQKPTGATSFVLYRFQGSNVTSFSTTSYNARSDAKAFNSSYDMVQISINNTVINFNSWSNYSAGNTNGAEVSAKGIKAENEIYIKSGVIDIKAYDDAIHANNDGSLENGSSPLGNIHISGGQVTVSASDDGIHADGQLNITGGTTNVTTSYEGLEGNVINVSGGNTYVYGTDDGVNATSGNSSPAINVSGGFLDVEVPTNGDTDGIDSNGTFTQTGGTVIVKGPGSASGGGMAMAAALDTDGAVKITSGSLIVFGAIEQTPNSSVTKTLVSSNTVSAGSHTIKFASNNTSYSTTLKSSSKGCVVYSSLGTATLS